MIVIDSFAELELRFVQNCGGVLPCDVKIEERKEEEPQSPVSPTDTTIIVKALSTPHVYYVNSSRTSSAHPNISQEPSHEKPHCACLRTQPAEGPARPRLRRKA
jgi:hypothetical protein